MSLHHFSDVTCRKCSICVQMPWITVEPRTSTLIHCYQRHTDTLCSLMLVFTTLSSAVHNKCSVTDLMNQTVIENISFSVHDTFVTRREI